MLLVKQTALVTGANRGLGRAFCVGLLERGLRRVYAGTRSLSSMSIDDDRISPVKLDITIPSEIAAAAESCADVNLLINNAGVLRNSPALSNDSEVAARAEMETNFFGTLAMTRAFAPILARNGGGTIVNILSVASWFGNPIMATYCASKAAALALTNSIRVELRAQNTQVIAVFAGYLETDMAAHVPSPKTPPMQVVDRTLLAIEQGVEQVMGDEIAISLDTLVRTNPEKLYRNFEQRWTQRGV